MAKRDKVVTDKIYKDYELFFNHKIYVENLQKIRAIQLIPEDGFTDYEQYHVWSIYQSRKHLNKDRDLNNGKQPLDDDIHQLLKDMGYGSEWRKAAYDDIVFGKITDRYPILRSNKTASYIGPHIEKLNNTMIKVIIFPNTLKKDYDDVWEKIAKMQKTLFGYDRSRKRKNLRRDLQIVNNLEEKKGSLNQAINPEILNENCYGHPNTEAARLASKRMKKKLGQH